MQFSSRTLVHKQQNFVSRAKELRVTSILTLCSRRRYVTQLNKYLHTYCANAFFTLALRRHFADTVCP
jgi:hypothetical protein